MTPHASVTHPSQRVAYPFFVAAAVLIQHWTKEGGKAEP